MDKHFWAGVVVGFSPVLIGGAYLLYTIVRDFRSGSLFR